MTKTMQVVYSDDSLLHNPKGEMTLGTWKPYVESPSRLVSIKKFVDANPEFQVVEPNDYTLGPILDIHEQDYVEYLQTIYDEWVAEGLPGDTVISDTFPHPSVIGKIDPAIYRKTAKLSAPGKMGLFNFDMSVAFVKDSWRAAYASAQIALSAAHRLVESIGKSQDPASIYALCRPPGHHAAHNMAGGYCFINNVAVVTRFLQNYTLKDMNNSKKPYAFDEEAVRNGERSVGTSTDKKRILIIDIDYHHGNGTQSIFYDDPSVFYISLHGSPDYPFYTGSEEEKGEGAGLGYNINVPLHPQTTTDEIYLDNLNRVLNLDSVVKFDAEIVIVSLGLDTWCEDPVGGMKLLKDMETYKKMGSMMKKSPSCQNRPFLFVQEGGYTVEKLGDLAGRVLQGYLAQE